MKKILVTGATGFIGNHLIPELLKWGHKIIATGMKERQMVKTPWIDQVQYLKFNLNKANDDFFKYFQKPDKLIHLAWEGLPKYGELFHFEKNLLSSYFLIKDLVVHGMKDVTVLGSGFEYGIQNGELSEDLATKPVNSYALAKDTLRKFLGELSNHHSFRLKWVRLFSVYGDGQGKNSILEQLKVAIDNHEKVFNMTGGEQMRDYLPVEKVAEYIGKISFNDYFSGIVNCCSGTPISIRKLVENYLKKNKKSIRLNFGFFPYSEFEPMAFWGCTKKLLSLLREKKKVN